MQRKPNKTNDCRRILPCVNLTRSSPPPQCPYTVGPLGRYIAPAIVQGMTATDDGAVEVWCTDALDGDDWYFVVDSETDLRIYDRVQLVVDANGTPDNFADDKVIDALYCHDCENVED